MANGACPTRAGILGRQRCRIDGSSACDHGGARTRATHPLEHNRICTSFSAIDKVFVHAPNSYSQLLEFRPSAWQWPYFTKKVSRPKFVLSARHSTRKCMQMVDETFSAELADVVFDMLVSCCAASAWYVRFWPQSKHIIEHVILSCNAFALARRVLRSMLGDVSGADSRMFFANRARVLSALLPLQGHACSAGSTMDQCSCFACVVRSSSLFPCQ